MELEGKIKLIGETQSFGSNGFKKRDLVITTDDQYPQDIKLEFTQDKTEVLNGYKIGENVKCGINIRGREWINPQGEAQYFNSITGWFIKRLDEGAQSQTNTSQKNYAANATNGVDSEEPDDLPF